MRELTTRADRTVDAPAREIWAYRLDFHHLPEYNAAVRDVQRTDSGGTYGPGATYRFELLTGSRSSPVELTVTEALPGRLVAVDMDGAVPARERFELSPVDEPTGDSARCRVTIRLTLMVPDHMPSAHDEALLAHGQAQIAGELDRIRELFVSGAALSLEGGGDRG